MKTSMQFTRGVKVREGVNFSDMPLSSKTFDQLDRARAAEALVKYLKDLPPSETPLCVSISGPWGAGKSSFVNFMNQTLVEKGHPEIFIFNPWQQAVGGQVISSFFREFIQHSLSSKGRAVRKVSKFLVEYAEIIQDASLGFEWQIPGISKMVKIVFNRLGKQQSFESSRKRLAASLSKLESPKIVVIDDVDRLHGAEILEVFQLVRAVLNFNNLIFVLVFDSEHVIRELQKLGLPAVRYLEKIVQLDYQMPPIDQSAWIRLLSAKLYEWTQLRNSLQKIREDAWGSLLRDIVMPLVKTPRQLNRLLFSLDNFIDDDLGLDSIDLIAMETLRTLDPLSWNALVASTNFICVGGQQSLLFTTEARSSAIKKLRSMPSENSQTMGAILREIFGITEHQSFPYPNRVDASDLLFTKRLRHVALMSSYMARTASSQLLIQGEVERLFDNQSSSNDIENFLRTAAEEAYKYGLNEILHKVNIVDKVMRPEIGVAILRVFEVRHPISTNFLDVFEPKQLIRAFLVGQVELGSSLSVVENYLDSILRELNTISGKWFLLDCISTVTLEGKLSTNFVSERQAKLLDQLAQSPKSIGGEFDLGRVLAQYCEDRPTPIWAKNSNVFKIVLTSLVHNLNSANGTSTKALRWESVKKIYPQEIDVLLYIKEMLTSNGDAEVHSLALLADDYRQGLRDNWGLIND